MSLAERLRDRLETENLSQSELARRVGITQGTVGQLLSGGSQGSKHLHRIARELGTTAAFLTGDTDDPSEGALPAPTPATIAEQLGMTLLPEIDMAYSMGGGSVIEDHPESRMVPFRSDWIRRITKGQRADLFLTKGKGDSMMPTILDEDDVIVNRAETVIRDQDLIWALGYGELGQIKRVRRLASGVWQLRSDNQAVPPIEASEDELFVVGRVVWIGRRM